jgi:hypothetical protein
MSNDRVGGALTRILGIFKEGPPLSGRSVLRSFYFGGLPGLCLPLVIWAFCVSPQNLDIVKLSIVASVSNGERYTEWRIRDEHGVRQVISAVTDDGQRYGLLTPAQVRFALRPKWRAVNIFQTAALLSPFTALVGLALAWFFLKRSELEIFHQQDKEAQKTSAKNIQNLANFEIPEKGANTNFSLLNRLSLFGTRRAPPVKSTLAPVISSTPAEPLLSRNRLPSPTRPSMERAVEPIEALRQGVLTEHEAAPRTQHTGKTTFAASSRSSPGASLTSLSSIASEKPFAPATTVQVAPLTIAGDADWPIPVAEAPSDVNLGNAFVGASAKKLSSMASVQESIFKKSAGAVRTAKSPTSETSTPVAQQTEMSSPEPAGAKPPATDKRAKQDSKLDLGEIYQSIDWKNAGKSIPNYFEDKAP